MQEVPNWVSPILTIIVSFFLPWLIQYVATSTKRWLNWLTSLGTSAIVGVLGAWIHGDFGTDIWVNLTLAITATQTAYNMYWKSKIQANTAIGDDSE